MYRSANGERTHPVYAGCGLRAYVYEGRPSFFKKRERWFFVIEVDHVNWRPLPTFDRNGRSTFSYPTKATAEAAATEQLAYLSSHEERDYI